MQSRDFAIKRLRAFIEEVGKLKQGEFPYQHSKEALEKLNALFSYKLKQLEQYGPQSDPDTVKQECAVALRTLFTYLPLLGFVLRSTNVRNAFEVYGPLLRLADNVLEPGVPQKNRKTRLLLSSEWNYSPFTYTEVIDLSDFVLIGLPAPESANPLLIPLAGHELGHALWAKKKLSAVFKPAANRACVASIPNHWPKYQQAFPWLKITAADLTSDLLAFETWSKAVQWAIKQAEETFCDFVGVRVFGTSYLNAFAYLLSPNYSLPRSANYPNMRKRARNLGRATGRFGIKSPPDYANLFDDLPEPNFTPGDIFQLLIADEALEQLLPQLIDNANDAVTAAGIGQPSDLLSDEQIRQIYERFRRVVPAENTRGIVDILNAGWMAFEDVDLWKDLPEIQKNKDTILKELMLKSVEIFEIEQILKEEP